MHPKETSYQIAATSYDYKLCHAFLREMDLDQPLSYPTIIARRKGEVIGLVSTNATKKGIIATALAVSPKVNRGITAVRLAEAYDNVMRYIGVKAYVFGISDKNKGFQRIMEKVSTGYQFNDEKRYVRKL